MDAREAALRAEEEARFSGNIGTRKLHRAKSGKAVYLITSAQNNTHVHNGFWQNLLAYQKHLGATLYISQFTYNKSTYGEKEVKPGTKESDDYGKLWYAAEILPFSYNERLALTRNLILCGEVNIIPTAIHPLSGFENYTGRASGIFPHAKQVMESVASLKEAKLLYTTGACTLRNYLQKKAGQRAEYAHAYGCLIVEIEDDGNWFVRQVRATEDGSFQDLDRFVYAGSVTKGNPVEAIQWGDIHLDQIDPVVRKMNWGNGGILDSLSPRYQLMHDTLDFLSRNHHEAKDPHRLFDKYVNQQDDVAAEMSRAAVFLTNESYRSGTKTIVVESNHDAALTRWLRESDFRFDPKNAEFFLKAQAIIYGCIRKGKKVNALKELMQEMGVKDATFLDADASFSILGIECGLHGHFGSNGSRSNNFTAIGQRVNVGHSHSARIRGDQFTAGTCSKLRLSYNRGPSSWTHSHIVIYPNGCRTIITSWKGKWRGS